MKKEKELQKLAGYVLKALIDEGYVDMDDVSGEPKKLYNWKDPKDINSNIENYELITWELPAGMRWDTPKKYWIPKFKTHTCSDNCLRIDVLGEQTFVDLIHISHGEIRIKVAWGLGLGPYKGNNTRIQRRRFYGAEFSFWIERKKGSWIQGRYGSQFIGYQPNVEPYVSKQAKPIIEKLKLKKFKEFENEGKFFM